MTASQPYPGSLRFLDHARGRGHARRRGVVVAQRPRGARRRRADAAVRRRHRRRRRGRPSTSPASRRPTCSWTPPAASASTPARAVVDRGRRVGRRGRARRRLRARRRRRPRRRPRRPAASTAPTSSSTTSPSCWTARREARGARAPRPAPASRSTRGGWSSGSTTRRDLGLTETLFAVGNGYLGMRANPEEGRDAHSHGTFLNGFHETWQHPPRRGRVRLRQDRPDHRQRARRQADEAVRRRRAAAADERRPRGLRADARLPRRHPHPRPGVAHAGRQAGARPHRSASVSLAHRHLAMLTFEVTMLDGSAPVVVSSQLLNRQDGEDEYHVPVHALGHGQRSAQDAPVRPPRARARGCTATDDGRRRARLPLRQQRDDAGVRVPPHRRHRRPITTSRRRSAPTSPRPSSRRGCRPARRCASSSSSRTTRRRACRPRSSPIAATARSTGRWTTARRRSSSEQRAWLDDFWAASDVELRGDDAGQQAVRWNLFQLAQASAQTQEHGIAAKGVTGGGYEGHYFWDTEMYVVPFLAYTSPETARKAAALPLAPAAAGPAAGDRAQPGRRAVPVAHDQRRGGVGVLRRRHRAVPHQRGDRLRPQALPRRQRRHRLPRRRRRPRSSSRRRGCGRTSASTPPTARRSSASTASPGRTSTRPSSTTTCTRT